jgi:Ser-tRNA(Ala) deacylase AlaX
MTTKALYLENTYLFQSVARIKAIESDAAGIAVILDQTIFYPQGGGQPADTGTISSRQGDFQVTKVLCRPDGTIAHYGLFSKGEFAFSDDVSLAIDKNRRMLNARNHTAGHLLTFAVEKEYPYLIGLKGYHFPDGPYVEFAGSLAEEEKAHLPNIATKAVIGIIERKLPVDVRLVTPEELAKLCKNILPNMPKDKPIRAMIVDGAALGCGGTHLKNTEEVGTFSVRKAKQEKGVVKISYTLS